MELVFDNPLSKLFMPLTMPEGKTQKIKPALFFFRVDISCLYKRQRHWESSSSCCATYLFDRSFLALAVCGSFIRFFKREMFCMCQRCQLMTLFWQNGMELVAA